MNQQLEFHLTVPKSEQQLLELLSEQTSLTKSQLKQAMDKGALWLSHKGNTRRLRRAKSKLLKGDELHLYFDPNILQQTPRPPQLIYDAVNYSIWFKPYGVFCQGSKWSDHCVLHRLVEKSLQRNCFPVHRLDRAAQGLVIVAHSKTLARQLSSLFELRQIHKVYRAIVHGELSTAAGKGTFPITVNSPIKGKPAISHITPIECRPPYSMLEVNIETGRKHQIRRHLADIGHPIVGDRLYGPPLAEWSAQPYTSTEAIPDLQLSAHRLAFNCPLSGQPLNIVLPDSLKLALIE